MNALQLGEQDMLINLCEIFRISPAIIGPNKRSALAVLGILFTMPMIEDRSERRSVGNTVLKAAHAAVPPSGSRSVSQFQQQVAGHVVMMQAFPGFHGNFRLSEEGLQRKYAISSRIVKVLKVLGIGAGGSALTSALGTFVETKSASAAAGVGVRRLAGVSDLTDAVRKRAGLTGGGRLASNAISVALVAIATSAYASASANIAQVKQIADHRFKSGDLSESAYHALFPASDPRGIDRYWEY